MRDKRRQLMAGRTRPPAPSVCDRLRVQTPVIEPGINLSGACEP